MSQVAKWSAIAMIYCALFCFSGGAQATHPAKRKTLTSLSCELRLAPSIHRYKILSDDELAAYLQEMAKKLDTAGGARLARHNALKLVQILTNKDQAQVPAFAGMIPHLLHDQSAKVRGVLRMPALEFLKLFRFTVRHAADPSYAIEAVLGGLIVLEQGAFQHFNPQVQPGDSALRDDDKGWLTQAENARRLRSFSVKLLALANELVEEETEIRLSRQQNAESSTIRNWPRRSSANQQNKNDLDEEQYTIADLLTESAEDLTEILLQVDDLRAQRDAGLWETSSNVELPRFESTQEPNPDAAVFSAMAASEAKVNDAASAIYRVDVDAPGFWESLGQGFSSATEWLGDAASSVGDALSSAASALGEVAGSIGEAISNIDFPDIDIGGD